MEIADTTVEAAITQLCSIGDVNVDWMIDQMDDNDTRIGRVKSFCGDGPADV